MRMALPLVLPLLLSAVAAASAAEDRLVLTDGRTIVGTYLGGDDQEVRFLYTNAEMVIPRRRVRRLDFAADSASRPVAFLAEPTAAPVAVVLPQPVQQVVYQAQPQVIYQVAPPTVVRYVEVERPDPRWTVSLGWYAGSGFYGHRRSFGPTWGIGYSNWYGCR